MNIIVVSIYWIEMFDIYLYDTITWIQKINCIG